MSVNESFVNPVPGPVMNSLVSETKVVCNESIPNPITPVPIPIPILPAPDAEPDPTKAITILNGLHVKSKKSNMPMNTEHNNVTNDLSPLSSMSPSEPMDCNSTPNASPAHATKSVSSNEDVAMSENTSVSFFF